jgi:hypothetical protein
MCGEPIEAGSPLDCGLCRECQEIQKDAMMVRRRQEMVRAMNADEVYGQEESKWA